MFGFMSKKDKRIKELEERLYSVTYKHPTIISSEKNTVALGASVILEDTMPVAYAKETLSKKFLEIIKDNIYYDIEDHDGRKILKGYLRIVQKDV